MPRILSILVLLVIAFPGPVVADKVVALKSVQNCKYVRAGMGKESYLAAFSRGVGIWEKFKLINFGNGVYALRSLKSGKYVRTGIGNKSYLAANSDKVEAWERFHLVSLGGGQFALQSLQNKRYVRAGMGKESYLAAYNNHIYGWEKFFLIDLYSPVTDDLYKNVKFTPIEDFPFDRSYEFANDIQGVTHDSQYWYLTQAIYPWYKKNAVNSRLAKVRVTTSLNEQPKINYKMPKSWHDYGWRHYGDLTYAKGRLYVALEGGGRGGVGAFDTQLKPIGFASFNTGDCPWIAYNSRDDYFYTSDFHAWELRRYQITVQDNKVIANLNGKIPLIDRNCRKTLIDRVQGGTFSKNGRLYVTSDIQNGGIRGIDVRTGMVFLAIRVNFDKDGEKEELEGITLWDLDSGVAPGIRGQVHVLMIQNEISSNDDLYFKHFRVNGFPNM